uniref:Choline/carnitine acyltransferase domain-containing protein n=1 Tax=Kryptolebias marmoratus TaxID=37003 RepID=A0A3Q3FC11_KRYMA
ESRLSIGPKSPKGPAASPPSPVSATRVAGRYLTHQRGLPALPVPPLQQTCERYLAALEPLVEAEELTQTRELTMIDK